MGFDEENLEPKIRKSKKNESLKSYLVTLNEERREISCVDNDDLNRKIRDKFQIGPDYDFKMEYWSNPYQEWLILDTTLPDNNARIRIDLVKPKNYEKETMEDEIKRELELITGKPDQNELILEKKLNSLFGRYISTENAEFLNNFETAVIFITKRNDQSHSKNIEHIDLKFSELQLQINSLGDELKKIKTTSKALKNQVESLNGKLDQPVIRKSSKKPKSCIIC